LIRKEILADYRRLIEVVARRNQNQAVGYRSLMTDLIAEDLASLSAPGSSEPLGAGGQNAGPTGSNNFAMLQRPRLSSRGDRGPTSSVTVVHAPAGYGKSCLLDQWQAELERAGPPPLRIEARATGAYVSHGNARRKARRSHLEVVALLANWQSTSAYGIVLIDNGHFLPDATQRVILDMFLGGRDSAHRVVVATRWLPGIPLSRAKALGQLSYLDAQDLSFSSDEVAALVSLNTGAAALLPEQIAAVADLAEGWPLAQSLCLSRQIAAGASGAVSPMNAELALIHDFINEEIIQQQSPRVRDFLYRTAPLLLIESELCNAVLATSDSALLIKELGRSGLFLGQRQDQANGYRYHRLFARSLRALASQADPAGTRHIATRAIDWFESRNLVREAFDQAADIEDWDRAARIFDQHCVSAYSDGRGQELATMALRFPRTALENYPRAMVYAARVASLRWRFGVVENLLHRAAEQIRTNKLAGGDPTEFDRLMLHCRMLLAQFEDNQADAERICVELLEHCDHFDHHTRGTIYGSLLYARRELFNFSETSELEAAGVREFNHCGSQYGMVLHLCIAGTARAMTGDMASAVRQLTKAMKVAAAVENDRRIVEFPAALLAELHYERNELDRSRSLLSQYFPSMQMGFVDQYIAAYITDARLKHIGGGSAEAHLRLDEGLSLAETHALDRLRHHVVAERIRLFIVDGAIKEALRLGTHEGLLGLADEVVPKQGCTSRDEVRAKSWVRLAVLRGATIEACRIARKWLKFTTDANALRASIQWEIVLAHCQAVHGDDFQAQRTLRSAVSRAAPGVCVRSFLDEGSNVRSLLKRQHDASRISTGMVDRFVAELMDCDSRERAPTRADGVKIKPSGQDPLSQREVDILQMASAGMRNVDIAKRVGLTEGSVKWYLQQIYDRIGVRRRAGAIERARELGLLH
jgi:LuxR family transcriptional regulator, maltose regulon positive regulatory protein